MARRGKRQDEPTAGSGRDGDADALSAAVVQSLLHDGYGPEEIAAFYDLPVRRVRRFLRRHGLEEVAGAESPAFASPEGADPWGDPQSSPAWRRPSRLPTGQNSGRRGGRRLSAAQIDELCTLYLDPSLSIGEVASYFDLDQETAQALIDERLTGIVPRA